MVSKRIKRVALVVAFVGLSAGGWLATRDAGPVVDAIGGTWIAPDATWHEIDGAYRGALVYEPHRVELASANAFELLNSLCDATMAQLDRVAPDGVSAQDVYRLDLNVAGGDGTPVFPRFVPVVVRDGSCQPAIVDDLYFPTYPAPLEAWYLSRTGLVNAQEGAVIPIVEFQDLPGAQPSLDSFDFVFACKALMDDPVAWEALGAEPPKEGQLRLVARSGINLGSVLKTGVFQQHDMVIADGTCSIDGAS